MSEDRERIRRTVREGYRQIARGEGFCCGPGSGCCGGDASAVEVSRSVGYGAEEIATVSDGANLGLGCGNPVALASLQPGEVVLDLGCGAGFDCFLPAQWVGKDGRVIGVDMTPEMIERARANARKGNYSNVEFRLGEIEHLPIADGSVDVVISNCVINLSPEKEQVFREVFQVLKPGGRLMVADIVLNAELPSVIRKSVTGYVGCISGAVLKTTYLNAISAAGFVDIRVMRESGFPLNFAENDATVRMIIQDAKISMEELRRVADSVLSVSVFARKPA